MFHIKVPKGVADKYIKDFSVVLFPDPALKEGKGLVYIECILGRTGCSMS